MTRQSAPTDGRDASGNIVTANKVALTSKQNSDARGMLYQWGRKDPFTFATTSEKGGIAVNQYGKYPVKIYTIDGVLIYQEGIGLDNTDKQPAGGIIVSLTLAISMMETIKNPITFYANNNAVINQEGQTRDMWDYYWTSCSRGIDGEAMKPSIHFYYLDEYKAQRLKSIFDPCPFGFRVSSNGTYSNLKSNPGWNMYNYTGGLVWNNSISNWYPATGYRSESNGSFLRIGEAVWLWSSMLTTKITAFYTGIYWNTSIVASRSMPYTFSPSVRCIEDCDPSVRPDRRVRR